MLKKKTFIYADHAATTPLLPEVLRTMRPYFFDKFGNASTLHSQGRQAHKALEEARKKAAEILEVSPDEIVFTSGGTESDNLAMKGAVERYGRARTRARRGHIISTQIEHHAILHTLKYLEKQGFKVTYLPVDETGRIKIADLKKAFKNDTILVSMMYANNEVGTIQPISEVAKICKKKKVLFHTDAVQAPGHASLSIKNLGADLLSLSAHKFHGPQGVGLLYVRKGVELSPQNIGGSQEKHLRSGTQNLPGIIGMVRALEIAEKERKKETTRLEKLRKKFITEIKKNIPDLQINENKKYHLPHIVNVSFAGIEGEALLLKLDEAGIAVSTASACSSDSLEPSHVLKAMGVDSIIAHGTVRFSFGRLNKTSDINYILKALPKIVAELRQMSPIYVPGMLKKK